MYNMGLCASAGTAASCHQPRNELKYLLLVRADSICQVTMY